MHCALTFDELDDLITEHELGWAIQQKEKITCKDTIRKMRKELKGCYQGRSASNWSMLLICAKEVSNTFCCVKFHNYSC